MWNRKPACVLLFLAVLAMASRLDASQSGEVTSTDVYRHVQELALDLEQLRIYMGRPRVNQIEIEIRDVAPREVIYQVQTLFRKVNRLSYEMIREVRTEPVVPEREIVPADIMEFVSLADEQVKGIAKALQIELTSPVIPDSDPKSPTDVYEAVLQLSRQVNLMLDQRFSPAEAYEGVSQAIAHAASLRGRWPERRIPAEPDWELGKVPADVYRLLLECIELVRSIAELSDHQILEFSVSNTDINNVTPGDVYDLASLIVSELAYLDRMLRDSPSKKRAMYPGRKVPSDVYQRAGILKIQLEEINDLLESQSSVEGKDRE